jgi:hypothetical protein
LWQSKGNRIVRFEERKVRIEDEGEEILTERTLPFSPISGAVTDDGTFVVVASKDELLLASVVNDQIHFQEQNVVKMEGSCRVLSAWRSGAYVNVLRSTSAGPGRYRIAIGSRSATPVHAMDSSPGPELWTAAVQSDLGFANVNPEGSVSAQGPLRLALGNFARDGWRSLDLAQGIGGPREWVVGLRERDDVHELVVTTTNGSEWSAMKGVPIHPAEWVLLTHPFSPTAPALHLGIDGDMCSWRLSDFVGVGAWH